MLVITWFTGNLSGLDSSVSEQEVVRRIVESHVAENPTTIKLRWTRYGSPSSTHNWRVFDVHGQEIAEIEIQDFFNFGWRLTRYEYIGKK